MVGPSHRVLDGFGHVEWEQNEVGPEIVFPAAPTVAAADMRDSRFASAVLATVVKSLLFARSATEHAKVQAGRAADEVRWAAECPPDVSLCRWLQRKRRERDTGRKTRGGVVRDMHRAPHPLVSGACAGGPSLS